MNASLLLAILSLAVSVGLAVWVALLYKKLQGRQAHHDQVLSAIEDEGIEGMLAKQARDITRLSHDSSELYRITEQLQEQMLHALSRFHVMRFNPFEDGGGNQSFTCALLDQQANGIVISSLHHRSGNRIYAKPIHGGTSEFPLSEEEQRVMQEAMQMAHTNTSQQASEQESAS